jgi:hypothetical protein
MTSSSISAINTEAKASNQLQCFFSEQQSIVKRLTSAEEHVRVDQPPNRPDQSVQPLHTLRHRRRELLSPLPMHLQPDPLHLLLQPPLRSPSEKRASIPDRSEHDRPDDEGEPAAAESDEDPDEEGGGDGEEGESTEAEGDELHGRRLGGREGLEGDVGWGGGARTDSGVVNLSVSRGRVERAVLVGGRVVYARRRR